MPKKKVNPKTIPETKIPEKKTIPLTKSQKVLFITRRDEGNKGVQAILEAYNVQLSKNLGRLVDDFIAELNIDTVNEDWRFNANTFNFTKTKSKEE